MTNQCTEFWMLGSIPRWFQKSLGTETVVPVTGDKNDEKSDSSSVPKGYV
jgi:hypothetical protein